MGHGQLGPDVGEPTCPVSFQSTATKLDRQRSIAPKRVHARLSTIEAPDSPLGRGPLGAYRTACAASHLVCRFSMCQTCQSARQIPTYLGRIFFDVYASQTKILERVTKDAIKDACFRGPFQSNIRSSSFVLSSKLFVLGAIKLRNCLVATRHGIARPSLSLSLSSARAYPRGRSEIQCATGRGLVEEIHMQGATDFLRKAW